MKTSVLCVVIVAALAFALPQSVEASVIFSGTGEGWVGDDDGLKEVSASVKFSVVGNNLVINLQNTGTRTDYTMAQVLTDVTFSTSLGEDLDFLIVANSLTDGSKVEVAPGSDLYHYDPEEESMVTTDITNISQEWGLASIVLLPPADGDPDLLGPYDFSVTGTAPLPYNDEDGIAIFADGDIEPSSSKLNGGDFGLINLGSIQNESIGNRYMVSDAVEITLVTDGIDLSNLQITEVALSYGSSHDSVVGVPDDPVPEPASLIIWGLLGAGCAGISVVRRRRRHGGNVASWSEENRRAICQIVERGRLNK